jgi:hypothetical protein
VPLVYKLAPIEREQWSQLSETLCALEKQMRSRPGCSLDDQNARPYRKALTERCRAAADALKEAGLDHCILDGQAWNTEDHAESWTRALLQCGFAGEGTGLAIDQRLAEIAGRMPAGFFDLMASRMESFTNEIITKTKPLPLEEERKQKSASDKERQEVEVPLEMFACPDCGAVLPERLRVLSSIRCQSCGRSECNTGIHTLAVAGPGKPATVQLHGPVWLPVMPRHQTQERDGRRATAGGNDSEARPVLQSPTLDLVPNLTTLRPLFLAECNNRSQGPFIALLTAIDITDAVFAAAEVEICEAARTCLWPRTWFAGGLSGKGRWTQSNEWYIPVDPTNRLDCYEHLAREAGGRLSATERLAENWTAFVFRTLRAAGLLQSRSIVEGRATLSWYAGNAFAASAAALDTVPSAGRAPVADEASANAKGVSASVDHTEAQLKQPTLKATLSRPLSLPPARHSRDYRSVHWFGSNYSFTATQAACIQTLWEAWAAGTPEIGQETILDQAGSESKRLVEIFKGHDAWKTMIVPGSTKGTFKLSHAMK